MEFRVLGPLEVEEDGHALPLGGAKQRALLATLLVRANRVVSVDALLDELWGEQPPDSAANMIQGYVSRLRKVFASDGGDVIVHSPPGYVLRVEPERIDSHRFEHLLRESTEARSDGDLEAAAARLREALALWRGAALSDVEVNSFVEIELSRLEELRLSAIEERIDIDLALGHHSEIVAELEALVAEHPLRERLRRELMLALYRCDRQAEALSAYRSGRHHLVEELGIEPGPSLRELERAILAHDPSVETPVVTRPAEAPAKGVRSRRRRGLFTAAATLAIGGAVAVAVVGFRGADSSTVTVPENSVGVIDPSMNRVTDAIVGIGPNPGGLAVANGAVWVANRGDQTVARVSARTHELVRTIPVHGTPTGIAAADGGVWVAHGFQGTLERIDTRYDQVVQRIGVLSARCGPDVDDRGNRDRRPEGDENGVGRLQRFDRGQGRHTGRPEQDQRPRVRRLHAGRDRCGHGGALGGQLQREHGQPSRSDQSRAGEPPSHQRRKGANRPRCRRGCGLGSR